MSMHSAIVAALGLALDLVAGPALADSPGLGKPLNEAEIAPWDISIDPDGKGLPPGGGTPQKPVGMVVIAVLAPDHDAYVRTFNFLGARTQVKFQATQAALDRVRRMIG